MRLHFGDWIIKHWGLWTLLPCLVVVWMWFGAFPGAFGSPWWKWATPQERARGGAIPGGAGRGSGRAGVPLETKGLKMTFVKF